MFHLNGSCLHGLGCDDMRNCLIDGDVLGPSDGANGGDEGSDCRLYCLMIVPDV